MMIDDDGIDVAVVGQTIEKYREFRIQALQTSSGFSAVEHGNKRANAGLHEITCSANRDALRAGSRDAVNSANRNGPRWSAEKDSICAGRVDSVRASDGYGVCGAA